MNATTVFEETDKMFAEIITNVIESIHQSYECDHKEKGYDRVSLENIHFGIVKRVKSVYNRKEVFLGIGHSECNAGIPQLQQIAKKQGHPDEDLLITAQRMLDRFCCMCEIEKTSENIYKLSTSGDLYKDLIQEIASC